MLSEETLARARAGDGEAFRELTDPYRRELQLHCYRILGSVQDAEDLLQETLLAAWRGLDRFQGRSSLRAWLYRIATNRCLNALRDSGRRPQRTRPQSAGLVEPTRWAEPVWLEPYPDVLLEGLPDRAPGPEARYEAKEATGLAFMTALQHLPPRQRAVLVLRDVLGFPTAEIADMLGGSQPSVKGALQRARATLQAQLAAGDRERAPLPDSARERELVRRFADAVESGDVDSVVALLGDDAWLTMPPLPHQYQGHDAIAAFLRERAAMRGAPLQVVATRANTQPAFACYLPVPHAAIARAYGLLVLTLEGERVAAITFFLDTSLFAHFGLPRTLRV
ncbi:MAG TPA: sigma-70 family RNA polymerase sigma factor [Actinomycetes bacterium]|nr:sigma-70 family RNA polymerase sigma factor [Actinomycetes bacterium]